MRLRVIILAMLFAKGPNTGYGLGRMLKGEFRHVWVAKLQQIYAELSGLRGDGLVAVEVSENKRNSPSRKLYSLTYAGEAELKRWFETKSLSSRRDDLLARLICLDRTGGVAGLKQRLQERLDERQAEAELLEAQLSVEDRKLGEQLALDFELRRVNAEWEWCRDALALLGETNGAGIAIPGRLA